LAISFWLGLADVNDFAGKLAVITGGGSGMGRELAIALADAGCHVALCDVSQSALDGTASLCSSSISVYTHLCDVSDEASVVSFRDAVAEQAEHVHLLFNNAGIGGGGSFVVDNRDEWERTFNVCWYGVYYCSRAFLPLLVASDEAHIVNTSSINGFWASLGPNVSHTAYSSAKFAVKGFSEALVSDLRLNAPHVGVSVVMPGHIGTDIAANTGKVLGRPSPDELDAKQLARVRRTMVARGLPVDNQPDDHIRALLKRRAVEFKTNAPTSAAQAAEVILSGVRNGRWRILVGDDACALDEAVRDDPEQAYEPEFIQALVAQGHMRGVIPPAKP
jgi:NAD(P)-dependent dehydrogenase (short-subunit alcohol dehydrogenase family)